MWAEDNLEGFSCNLGVEAMGDVFTSCRYELCKMQLILNLIKMEYFI